MSGFIAVINTDGAPIDRSLLEELTASLYFRGPDRQQVWADGPVGLGHTLFRTTDEARHENQPASLDGKVWITGCIRIDVREELLDKLGMQREIRLTDTPDSHLVLHAYRFWGEQCLEHLLGDFSFALWDSRQRKLFCARDRFGMRQLCYAQQGNTFIVSNSIHSIRQHPNISDRLSKPAIGDFLLFGDHRWGDRSLTAFAEIRAVEPAHCLLLQNNAPKIRRYWDVSTDIPLLHYQKESEYLEHFEEIFKVAVSDRLRTRDIVISLSGGMDSSSIAAVVRKLRQERNQTIDLNGVTVLFDSIHPSDERYFVDQVNRHLNLPAHYIDGGLYPLLSPPVQTTCPLELYQPQLWLDQDLLALTKGRVMLNGEAGDEIFAFSSIGKALRDTNPAMALLIAFQLRYQYGAFPGLGTGLSAKIKRLVGRAADSGQIAPYPDWINPDLERELDLKGRWSHWNHRRMPKVSYRHPNLYCRIMEPDWNTDDYYMNCGFTLPEKRSPFLDPRLVDFMMSIPALPWLFKKHLLRRAMTKTLPKNIIQRPKTALGFIHDSLLKEAAQVSTEIRTPAPQLTQYVNLSRYPVLGAISGKGVDSYVGLRPLLLNTWLQGL